MAALTYCGPQEMVFPLELDPAGAGTLVLRPGADYDFGLDEQGEEAKPPGPAWWWNEPGSDAAKLAKAAAEAASAPAEEPAEDAPDPRVADNRPQAHQDIIPLPPAAPAVPMSPPAVPPDEDPPDDPEAPQADDEKAEG